MIYKKRPGCLPVIKLVSLFASILFFAGFATITHAASSLVIYPYTISAGNPTASAATITFASNLAGTSTVNYGLTTAYGTASSSLVATTSHSITLKNLTAASTYHFQITAYDSSGDIATSSDQTFVTVNQCTYYVDSVSGSDANAGNDASVPFQHLLAVPAVTNGASICLRRGSVFKDFLVIGLVGTTSAINNITVKDYGPANLAMPLIDNSDAIASTSWSLTPGTTNVYQTTVPGPGTSTTTPYGTLITSSSEWINVWECKSAPCTATGAGGNDTFLSNQTGTSSVNSTAGSYYVAGMTSSAPPTNLNNLTIYVHPYDGSNPATNGYQYTYSNRPFGINIYGNNAAVSNIMVKKSSGNSGGFSTGGLDGSSATFNNIEADQDGKHNMLCSGGCTVNNSKFVDEYYPGSGNMFVAFDQVGSGLPITLNNDVFLDGVLTSGNFVTATYGHTGSTPLFSNFTVNGGSIQAVNGASWSGISVSANNETINGITCVNVTGCVSVYGTTTIANSQDYSSSTSPGFLGTVGSGFSIMVASSSVCDDVLYSHDAIAAASGNTVTVASSTFYFLGTAGGVSGVGFGGASSSLNLFNTRMDALPSTYDDWVTDTSATATAPYTGNNNIFAPNLWQAAINGVSYHPLSAWQAATGQDANSTTTSPTPSVQTTACTVHTLSFTGPSSGNVNAPSSNFTVTPNTAYNSVGQSIGYVGTVTMNPSGTGSTGLIPVTLTFTPTSSTTAQTFNFTPTATGTVTWTPFINSATTTAAFVSTTTTSLSYTANITTPSAPYGPIVAVAGNASATVSWSPPTSIGGSAITAYTVTSAPGNISTTTTTTTATLTGLSNGTPYTFVVTATNAAGTGASSTPSNSVTPNIAASLPTLTLQSASSIGISSATLNATMSADGGASSTVEGFNYGTTTAYGFTASTTGTFGVASFSQSVTGLSCGTTYHAQAFAINPAGTGTSTDSTFSTNACVTPIVLSTLSATGLSTSTATFNAQILATGGANALQSGFAYGTSSSLATVIATTTLGTQTGTTTFSQSFTNLTPNLTYYFRSYAVNSAGTTTGSILSFNTNDVTPPLVNLTTPTNGQIVAGSAVQLSATASDDVSVVGVQFKVGASTNIGSLITSTSSPNTYTTTWDSTGITTHGSHTLYAIAYDAAGNSSTSTVSVTVDNVAPTILSAVYNSSTQITVTLSAAASTSTITKANNGGFTITKTGSGTTYAVSAIAPGSSTTQVILTTADMTTAGGAGVVVTYASGGNGTITDTLGNILATNNTGITVPPWNTTAPIISSITSNVAHGAYTIGAPIDIDLTFSKNVNSTGSILVTLNTGGTCSFTVSNSNTTSCTYTVASGQNTAALNVASTSGVITSTDSNAMTSFAPALNLADNKNIVIDTIAPSVTLRSPTGNSTVSGHAVVLSATAADVGTGVAGVQFKLDGTTNISTEILSAPYTATWDSTAAADGTHTLSAVAVDGAGNYSTSSLSVITDNSTYTVGGTISGLTGTVVLQNNSGDNLTLASNGSFNFATALADNTTYAVSIRSQPSGQTCSLSNGLGTVSGGNVTSIAVNCASNSVPITYVSSGGGGGSASPATLAKILAPSAAATTYLDSLPTTATTTSAPPLTNASISTVAAGESGASVRVLQNFLVTQGLLSPSLTTGFFGALTRQAVIAFQIKHGIVASAVSPGAGIVGPKTTAAINSLASMASPVAFAPASDFPTSLAEGSTGPEVKALEEYLNANGFAVAQSGPGSTGEETNYFGALTEKALMKFQSAHGISATGFFGPVTRSYVVNH